MNHAGNCKDRSKRRRSAVYQVMSQTSSDSNIWQASWMFVCRNTSITKRSKRRGWNWQLSTNCQPFPLQDRATSLPDTFPTSHWSLSKFPTKLQLVGFQDRKLIRSTAHVLFSPSNAVASTVSHFRRFDGETIGEYIDNSTINTDLKGK